MVAESRGNHTFCDKALLCLRVTLHSPSRSRVSRAPPVHLSFGTCLASGETRSKSMCKLRLWEQTSLCAAKFWILQMYNTAQKMTGASCAISRWWARCREGQYLLSRLSVRTWSFSPGPEGIDTDLCPRLGPRVMGFPDSVLMSRCHLNQTRWWRYCIHAEALPCWVLLTFQYRASWLWQAIYSWMYAVAVSCHYMGYASGDLSIFGRTHAT